MDQRAHGLGAQDDLVARLDMLKLGGQRPVRHLDGVELQLLVPGRRGDGIGPQQRLDLARLRVGVAHQADHHELARAEAQRLRTGAAEPEQPVGVMLHLRHGLRIGQCGRGLDGRGIGVFHGSRPSGRCGSGVHSARRIHLGLDLDQGKGARARGRAVAGGILPRFSAPRPGAAPSTSWARASASSRCRSAVVASSIRSAKRGIARPVAVPPQIDRFAGDEVLGRQMPAFGPVSWCASPMLGAI
jgi:hypothetical protein